MIVFDLKTEGSEDEVFEQVESFIHQVIEELMVQMKQSTDF